MTTDHVAPVTRGRIPQWTFADRLRKIRTDLDMEQRAMANKLGVGSRAYANWETGRRRPQDILSLARRVELISGVPAAWLLGVDGTTPGGGQGRPRQDSNLQPTD